MSHLDSALQGAVESFVLRLKEIFQRSALEKFQSAFEGGSNADAPRRRATKSAAARGKASKSGSKRSADELAITAKTLLAFVRKHPGQRMEQISEALSLSARDLALGDVPKSVEI